MKVLSKSRFKIGLECPNKLYYTHHKNLYPSTKEEDTFLQALAQGGFQVEELARMHYPGGHLIDNPHYDYEGAVAATTALLQQENVIIYEAAFLWNSLFIRSDVLVKQGNYLELIEVKAKLFDPSDEYLFIGKRGGIVSSWKPYLFDLAFQKYVIQNAFPEFTIKASLMMADKNKKASIDGLNQLFRVSNDKNTDPRKDLIKKVNSLEETGDSILSTKNVNSIIQDILENKYEVLAGHTFESAVNFLSETYYDGNYPVWPTQYAACKSCEFRANEQQLKEGKKSGFHECMNRQHQWPSTKLNEPNIFEIWNFRSKVVPELMKENRLLMHQLNEEDFQVEYKPLEISSSERRWIQVQKAVNKDESIYCLTEELKATMDQWIFPLHFIDFETSAVALPFTKGRRPYEQVAFQFSHHQLEHDGTITHQSEYISNQPGEFPNFQFARALMDALNNDAGTIFKFASHENTIINAIIKQLLESKEPDKDVLIEFLKTISKSKTDSTSSWKGKRNMVDLRKIVLDYYYNPLTKGSNSIKAVLPAVIQSSMRLRNKYSRPLKKIGVTSRNFPENHVWLKDGTGEAISPYKMLPPLFEGWNEEEMEETLSEMEGIADGGMALTAYARLQYVDMSEKEREELTAGLKKYCELDTLAMVMIYEHFREITQ
jgi:hypothetical protein